MDLELEGSVVLVTGGSDGLGRALVERLVAEGSKVAFCGRDLARIQAIEKSLTASGGEALGMVADVSRLEDIERFAEAAISCWGEVDGLVNNAGGSAGGALESTSDDEWLYDIETKVMAAVRLTRLVLPLMTAARRGSIVNILNIGSKAPSAGSLPSAASRAAGLAITKALSKEAAPHNVRVNAVLIGFIESGQGRRRAEAAGIPAEQYYATQGARIPLGRVGRPDEFADLVSYLLSARSSYVTGAAINLDGGSSPVV